MPQPAHISFSKNETLEERVHNFKKAYQNYQDAISSKQASKNKTSENTLGTSEEIDYANQVTKDSLDMAVNNINEDEIKNARQLNLITPHEADTIRGLRVEPNKKDQVIKNKEKIKQARAQSASSSKDKDNSRDY